MAYWTLLNLLLFAGLAIGVARSGGTEPTLSRRIAFGLLAGVLFGLALQWVYRDAPDVIAATLRWTDVLGTTYVNLLKLVIMPLVLVMMIAAVVRLESLAALGRIGGSVIALLLLTTVIAAAIGAIVASVADLSLDGMVHGVRELERTEVLATRQESIADLDLADMLVAFVPTNIFLDLTGARPTSVIAVVIFGVLFGIAALLVSKEDVAKGAAISTFIDTTQAIVMRLVRLILTLTPYGILALMTRVVAGSDAADIANLIGFVVASYVAIALMFAVHALLLRLAGIGTVGYFRTVWPVLTFAFSSRSSAATIPLTVTTAVEQLNLPRPIASIAATFGSTIGQNGCAGIYPAMLAVMIAPSVGIDPMAPGFFLPLLGVVAISSFGIAGVGGGATFAALVVLPAMGLPVALVALLISIEPLIDMARTALNVNGSLTAGLLTHKLFGSSYDAAHDRQDAQSFQ